MTYYKVKKEYDQKWTGYDLAESKNARTLTKDELYTKKEVEKLKIKHKYLICVSISKKNVFWFFGCRFEKIN